MSIGPTGVPDSVAGSPGAQVHGADVQRAVQNSTAQTRGTEADQRAAQAAEIGQTQKEQEVADRDADGRTLWKLGGNRDAGTDPSGPDEPSPPAEPPKSPDATGQRGNHVDLYG